MKKKYLTEVVFKNGVDEFKSFRNYTKKIQIETTETTVKSYRVELDSTEIDESSLTIEIDGRYEVPVYWRKVNGTSTDIIEVYTGLDTAFGDKDILLLNYVALNNYTSDLYSVDYENGLLYLANETNIALTSSYQFYNIYLTGDATKQLSSSEYSTSASILSINNKVDSYKYTAIYNLPDTIAKEYTTPFVTNIKINYLNTSEEESF